MLIIRLSVHILSINMQVININVQYIVFYVQETEYNMYIVYIIMQETNLYMRMI